MAGSDLTEPLDLQDYIISLDLSSLPRILQICSGVYFQGSVYEISGNECCLSTGDFVKVISVEFQKAICEDVETKELVELLATYTGYLQCVPETLPYPTIEELVCELAGDDFQNKFCFISNNVLIIHKITIRPGTPLHFQTVHVIEGQRFAGCAVNIAGENVCISIPFSYKAEFYEVEDERLYTLQEIVHSKVLRTKKVKLVDQLKTLLLTPVFEIHAVMQFRAGKVKIPSNLEVDIIDVTEQNRDLKFIIPVSLTEIINMPKETFPVSAEVLDPPLEQIFKCSWFTSIRKGKKIVIHGTADSKRILTVASKSKKGSRYFLVSLSYKGQFKKKPREFETVFELHANFIPGNPLCVVTTKDCECFEGDFPCLSVGDKLEVLYATETQALIDDSLQNVQVLVCNRICEDEIEEIMLPMSLEGRFVEENADRCKYTVERLLKSGKLPAELKVAVKDKSLGNDMLASLSSIKFEEEIKTSYVIISFAEDPLKYYELPAKWMNMSVCFTDETAEYPENLTDGSPVVELAEFFFYELRKLSPSNVLPPPRPPKKKSLTLSTSETVNIKEEPSKPAPFCKSPCLPPEGDPPPRPERKQKPLPKSPNTCKDNALPLQPCMEQKQILITPESENKEAQLKSGFKKEKKTKPQISVANEYTSQPSHADQYSAVKKTKKSKKKEDSSDDSDHDYELIDDEMKATISKMQEAVSFY
ncbi:protein THEMIS2-like [Protopterus annectens]|uniref:protein THEMIS2-like n=1 Tax=Protopterus annectens TaxID=7888 RepID=UPI001CFBABDA|nr:protein THEMIS2-like [Protopterus annectens]